MPVYFRCSECGGEHVSLVQSGSKEVFGTQNFTRISLQCPKTGKTVTVSKPDMFWKDEGEGGAGG